MVGPRLLKPTDIIDPTTILREPFTTTLGITICAEDTPWAEGTAGFFIAVTGLNKLFLVTAVMFSSLRLRINTSSAPTRVRRASPPHQERY